MMSQEMVGISLDELCLGTVCKCPVEDRRGMLLLGANASITSNVVRDLRDRNILQIRIDARDVDTICVEDAEPITLNPENKRKERIAKANPVKDLLIDCHDQELSESRSQQLDEVMVLAKAHFEVLREQLNENVVLSTDGFVEVAYNYTCSMIEDHDQTVGEVGAASVLPS